MESTFNEHTRVLSFQRRESRGEVGKADPDQRLYLLWPAFFRQLLIRQAASRKFNLFQAHVFRLCAAGIREDRALADFLGPPEGGAGGDSELVPLVRRIVGELQATGCLNDLRVPTTAGREQLTEDAFGPTEVTSCYCFQDPWTGELWDRFGGEDRLPMIEIRRFHTKSSGAKFAELPASKSEKSPVAFVVAPGSVAQCPLPNPEAIAEAYRIHHREKHREQMRRHLHELEQDDAFDDPIGRGGLSVESIQEARPVYLVARLIPRRTARNPRLWEAEDPFGFGPHRVFANQIDRILRGPAMKAAATLVQEKFDRGPVDLSKLSHTEYAQTIAVHAEQEVEKQLGEGVRDHADLFNDLLEMQIAVLDARQAEEAGRGKDRARSIRGAIISAQNALEGLFELLSTRFPTRECYLGVGLAHDNDAGNAAIFTKIAQQMGFEPRDRELPYTLARVKFGKIIHAADHNSGSVNPRILAAILAAWRSHMQTRTEGAEPHPLWNAARRYPNLLVDVDALGQARNLAAHAGKRKTAAGNDLNKHVEAVYRGVAVLLESISF